MSHHEHEHHHDHEHRRTGTAQTFESDSSGISAASFGGTPGGIVDTSLTLDQAHKMAVDYFTFQGHLHHKIPKSGLKPDRHRYSLLCKVQLISGSGRIFEKASMNTDFTHPLHGFAPLHAQMKAAMGNDGEITRTRGVNASTEVNVGPVAVPGIGAEWSEEYKYSPSSFFWGGWGSANKKFVKWDTAENGKGIHELLCFEVQLEFKNDDPTTHIEIVFDCDTKLKNKWKWGSHIKYKQTYTMVFNRDPTTHRIEQYTHYKGPFNDTTHPPSQYRWNKVQPQAAQSQ